MTNRLRFGPGGFPTVAKDGGVLGAINWCKEHGLGNMEMEFVHSTWLKEDQAPEVKRAAKKADVRLTAHGSYYINLNAKEEKKRDASRNRVLSAAYRTWQAGGHAVTFHPAFYLGQSSEKVYPVVKEQLKKIIAQLQEDSVDIKINPETTGKPTQFGTYEEICRLAEEIEQVGICVDFAHLHARTNGEYNTYEEFSHVLETIEKHLGREGLDDMHIHMSGIEYGPKGEKNHLPIEESDMNMNALIQAWKDFNIKGCVVSESPRIEQDALLMKKLYEQ